MSTPQTNKTAGSLTSKTQRLRCGAQGARVELIPAQDHLLLVALSA